MRACDQRWHRVNVGADAFDGTFGARGIQERAKRREAPAARVESGFLFEHRAGTNGDRDDREQPAGGRDYPEIHGYAAGSEAFGLAASVLAAAGADSVLAGSAGLLSAAGFDSEVAGALDDAPDDFLESVT